MAKQRENQAALKERKSAGASNKHAGASDTKLFPVIGIGASAGGLEALEQFLGNVPESSGMAYVVIQHLDPTQKGMLPELLQRVSKINVYQAKDRMVVEPNCVYVIPPNKSMSILRGTLYLFKPIEARGLRLPVDFFLRSLADDRQELCAGVILSGMGSDGSIGIRAIKEKNGIVMVQDPVTAKFDSMPRNAIASVIVDIVAPPGQLPEKLYAFLKHIPRVRTDRQVETKDKSALDKVIILLRAYTGNDFSLYKKSTLYRRIERRMGIHKIDSISSYVHFLQENPKEGEILFKELLIGVTNFFRDARVWEKLEMMVMPNLISRFESGSVLRAWVAGCSTGEEAYTLAINFKEALKKNSVLRNVSMQIFATDLDNEAIEIARKGIFPANIAADIPEGHLNRYFVKTEEGYSINGEIREMIVFAQHNIIMHPPFTRIDILSCRNLLIYLDSGLQKKILELFYYSLNPKGIMLLGSSETIGVLNKHFLPIDAKLKIYVKSDNAIIPDLINFPSSYSSNKLTYARKQEVENNMPNIQILADQVLLQQFSPPSILVNQDGDIIYINGRTGKYLEPATGKANLNVFAMLREGLRVEFPMAFQQAIREKGSAIVRNVRVGTNGNIQTLNVKIHWLNKPESLKGTLLIMFEDMPDTGERKVPDKTDKHVSSNRLVELESELLKTREEMQSTVEEMQASQEELKSTNEELQSANEELQSTNEELTSSKEELQSLNEELQTVNAELQSKVDEFSRLDNDMKNLLNSTDIATLFLDKELNIRRYTNQATKIFKLIKSDIGRPFTDQATDLVYPEMASDAIEVLRTLVFTQKHIRGKDDQWFSVRIMPYRTFDDRIDGLVITFINTSDLKKAETKLTETEKMLSLILNSSTDIIVKLSSQFKIIELSRGAEIFLGTTSGKALNQNFLDTFVPENAIGKAEKMMKKLLQEVRDSKVSFPILVSENKIHNLEWSIHILSNNNKQPDSMLLIHK
jgi:two-component system, chemotaxis family, CheB/CheR fusion protein